jgi:cyclase
MNLRYETPEEGLFLRVSPHCLTRTRDRGCNPGLVTTSDGVVFIDSPQLPSDAIAWIDAASQLGQQLILINTEHHIDHSVGNHFFDIPIIGQEGTRARFYDFFPIWGSSIKDAMQMFQKLDPEGAAKVREYKIKPPQITFKDQIKLYYGGLEIWAVNTPGHLPNSTVVYIPEDGVVFMSDTLVVEQLPWLHEADVLAWLDSLKRVRSWQPRIVVPGHGPVAVPAVLDSMYAFLSEVVEKVSKAINNGWSLEETTQRLDFLDRFTVLPHLKELAPKIQKMGLERAYKLLSAK